jgi:hypothetical protein
MASASREVKQQWKDDIFKQRSSGLSIAAWCRQNEVRTHIFYYWQGKLFPKTPLSRSEFTEIKRGNNEPGLGITLEYQGFSIRLDQHFDSSTLRRCLEVLKQC